MCVRELRIGGQGGKSANVSKLALNSISEPLVGPLSSSYQTSPDKQEHKPIRRETRLSDCRFGKFTHT
jgi:hypothetical protein